MEGITRRIINGKIYICKDIGCDNYAEARENRARISQGFALDYWKRLESILDTLPPGKTLPGEFKNLEE